METMSPGSPATGGPAGRVRRRPLARILAVVIGLGLLLGLAWYLVHRGGGAPAAGLRGRHAPATTVGVASVTAADIPVLIEALGTVTPAATVTVRPQVSGVIDTIAFREGQMVKKGELLAQIDRRPFVNALQQAQGALARDQAQPADARLQLERFRTLIGQDSIAQQQVDTQAATVRQLEGTLVADRAAVASAALDVEYSRITAPLAGRVGLRVVDAGNYISAGDAAGIAVITQLTPIDVAFTVAQDRVAEIQAGAGRGALPAVALDRTRTMTLGEGLFLTLDNQVDTSTGTVRAKARFANADGALFPSQFVNLRLQLRIIKGALVVPLSAVRSGAQGDFVYALNADQTVSLRPVKRGEQSGDHLQIIDGLKLGERVITEGGDRLKDGASVQLPDPAGSTEAAPGPKDGAAAGKPGQRHRRRAESGAQPSQASPTP